MSFRPVRVLDDLRDFWIWDVGRLWYDLTHLFSRGKDGAEAREDITHAYVNVLVEGQRATAYLVGHILAVGLPIWLIWRFV